MIAGAIAAVVVLALQQQPVPRDAPATPGPAGTGAITGRVVAADTGVPIRRAIVNISGGAPGRLTSQTIYTDPRGRYEARGLAPGSYVVSAQPNRFQGQFLPPTRPPPSPDGPRRITVADGQTVQNADIALPRAGAIVGRLVDENGDPVSGLYVGALRPTDRRSSTANFMSQSSDEFGRFRLFHLIPGDYQIVVRSSDGGDFIGQGPSLGFVETYYPGTYSRDEARVIHVRGGEETAAGDFQLARARMMTIAGRVLDSHGRPAEAQTMISFNRGDGGGMGTSVGPGGAFQFRAQPPGTYRLIARLRDQATDIIVEYGSMAVTLLDTDVEDVVVTLKPTVNVTGRVVFDGDPAPPLPADALSIRAEVRDRSVSNELILAPAAVARDATFTIRRLGGELLLRMSGTVLQTWMLKAVLLGDRDITDTPTEFREEDSGRLQIVLTTRASELSGTVTNDKGEPVWGSIVVLFSEDKTAWFASSSRVREGMTPRDGRFVMRGVKPGRYFLIALPRDRWPSLYSADAVQLEPLVREATPLVIGEDEQRVVDLKLAGGGGGW